MLLNLVLFCTNREEADEFVSIGALNGLFVLGRSIGFIGKKIRHFFPIFVIAVIVTFTAHHYIACVVNGTPRRFLSCVTHSKLFFSRDFSYAS